MKYYIIAGEASGDLHASNLMKELKKLDDKSEFRYWGGDLMLTQGGDLVKHYRDLAFMGYVEVLMNIRTIMKNIAFCKDDIIRYKPDALILVDYPGFNLRIAEFARKSGLKVYYYISPQVWAWKKSRVHAIKKNVDKMFTILPFEKEFYKQYNYNADFVGHPLLDAVADAENLTGVQSFRKDEALSEKPIIAVLPGSRKQEIFSMLPVMLQMIERFPDYEFVIAGVRTFSAQSYADMCKGYSVKIVYGKTYPLLLNAEAAMVTSGTATLETALFNVPEVVCYKTSPISYAIAKSLVNVKYAALPNLIMNNEIVKELIQSAFNLKNLHAELSKVTNKQYIVEIRERYAELKSKLGGAGASAKTASLIYENLTS